MKLNIGSGPTNIDGYVNIDGCSAFKPSMCLDLDSESLKDHFKEYSVSEVIAHDIIEHFLLFDAISLLSDIYDIMKDGAKIEIISPDTEYILNSSQSTEQKILNLYGSQGQLIGGPLDKGRKANPSYFCHKYGWTQISLKEALVNIGYKGVDCQKYTGSNLIAVAHK